jgi:hypothetical protein
LEVCRKDKDKEKELSLSKDKDENSSKDKDANIKKNSKQIASDSRLNYRPGQINSET